MLLKIKIFYPFRVLMVLREIIMGIEDLRREVAESRGAVNSAVTLIQGLRDRLDAMVDSSKDLEALQAEVSGLANELSDSTDSLAAAVAAPAPGTPEESAGPVENGNVNPGNPAGEEE